MYKKIIKEDKLYDKLDKLNIFSLSFNCLDKNMFYLVNDNFNYRYKVYKVYIRNPFNKNNTIDCSQICYSNNTKLGIDNKMEIKITQYFSKYNFNPFELNLIINYKSNKDLIKYYKTKWQELNNMK
jgi:hypothetical protein